MYVWIHIILWANVAFYITGMFVKLSSCTPREYSWNKLLPHGHCVNVDVVIVTAAVIKVASDFVILLLPNVRIWRRQTSVQKKFGMTAVFGVGFL